MFPTPPTQPRRRSIYNFPFFLRHQDAVETPDEKSSPILTKKEFKSSGPAQSLHPIMTEEPTNKPKRSGIISRRRAGSMKARPTSVTSINMSGCERTQSEKCHSSDVSIMVTEASPEGGNTGAPVRPLIHRPNSEATVVQVLVHRESEEYNNEEEEFTEAQSHSQIISQFESIPATDIAPTIDTFQTRERTNGISTTISTTSTDLPRPSTELTIIEGTTTDIVIGSDSNMSS